MGLHSLGEWKRLAVLATLVLLSFLGSFTAMAVVPGQGGGPPGYPPHVPGEILIRFQHGATPSDHANARALIGGQGLRKFRSGSEHWKTGQGVTTEQAIARLRGKRHVEYVEPNYIVTLNLVPNDPAYPLLWGLHNAGQTGGTPGADIDAEPAWNITTGSRSVLAAVIDTGIDYNHPDLAANMWTNPGEIAANHIDDDLNGYVDDTRGWDFVNNDNDPFDDHFHGTHVAGTIGAVGDNGIGVVGVNWQVSLIALKFLDAGGFGTTAAAIQAIDYATAMRFDMTNNSWGGGSFSQALLDSILAADAGNVLFVASAGNNGANGDVSPSYPAAYTAPNIISVAATDSTDARASFSNYGLISVDLGAPGVDVYSAAPFNSYQYLSGTSMAAPHVTGVAALLRGLSVGLPVAALKRAILDTVDPIPSLAGITVTGGRLNASRAISSLDQIPPGDITDLAYTSSTSNTVFLAWTATGDDGQVGTAAAYDVRYATTPIDATSFDAASRAPASPSPQPFGSAETMEVFGLAASTSYFFAVKAVDDGGNRGMISNVVTGTTLPPPTFASSPPDFAVSLFTGQTATRTLTLANTGVGTLDWAIPTPTVNGVAAAQQTPMTLAKGEPDPRVGAPAAPGSRGPDAFGYRFMDSDEPGGPEFSWYDLAPSGTAIATLDGDDQVSDPIPLGFGFPFYGNTFDAVRVSTNGFLGFTSSSAPYTNQPLPNSGAPENLVAPFWDDLDFSTGGRAIYARGASAFTLQFVNVSPRNGSGSYTFQVVLRESGEILFVYQSMSGPLDGATVGIQDGDRTTVLQAAFNAPYVHDNMAVLFSSIPQWLSTTPTDGRIPGGEAQDVTLHIDAAGLNGGTYLGDALVQTNDPLSPSVSHPVILQVTGAPAIFVSPLALDFGTVFLGFSSSLLINVVNNGTDDLTADLVSGNPSVTLSADTVNLAPLGATQVGVTLTTASLGAFTSVLTIASNAPNFPLIEIPITGFSVPAPDIAVVPSAYSESLLTGATLSRNLRVTNTGGSDLVLGATTEDAPAPPPSTMGGTSQSLALPTLSNGGFEQGSFLGWTATNNGGSELIPWTVSTGGADYFGVSSPSEGRFYALNGFDGSAGLVYDLVQDIQVPATSQGAILKFDDRIQYDSLGIPSVLPRIYEATIEDLGGTTLATIVHEEILLNGRPFTDLGWRHRALALDPFAGQTVRLHIRESIPETFTGPASIEFDAFRIEGPQVPTWLTVAPESATIPPGASHDFAVTFNASGSGTAVYSGSVRLETNIPTTPTLRVPAILSVTAAPDIAVTGEPVTIESLKSYSSSGARTSHDLSVVVPPMGAGLVELIADGDYGFTGETATATAEGTVLGTIGGNLGSDCIPATGNFPLTASQLAALVADGVVHVDVQNGPPVDFFCSINRHTIRLSYGGPADLLDFGSKFIGLSRSLSLNITNRGAEPLQVTSIATGLAEFVPSASSLSLAPGESSLVTVVFTPSAAATFDDAITILSNDPDTASVSVSLTGIGLVPPVAGVSPLSFESTLLSGTQEIQRLTLSNTGGSPLNFSLSAAQVAGTGSLRSVPFAGLSSQGGGASNNTASAQAPGDPPAVSGGDDSWLGVPGDFDRLSDSSGPLTCIVEDLASGMLYAQADQGTAFFRYRVAADVWEPLASVPIPSGNNGGAALLNGRIYTSYTESQFLGVYDIASNTWITILNPLGAGTGNIASDGTRYLYFVVGFTFVRFDPVTSITTTLGAPPFYFEPWGGMRHLSGVLYAHQGNGERGFASYSVATNTWTSLPSVPSGAVLGAALDAFNREYYAYGTYDGTNLYRYSIDSGVWSVATIPFFSVYDGGLGWLPSPVAGVYFVQGESGTGFARVLTGPEFLSFNPASGAVPASGSIDVDVTFDAAGLLGGVYLADVQMSSNDPIRPLISVPASLTVIGVPDIQITREPATIESIQPYLTSGASTSHTLPVLIPPTGGGSIDLIADGDYGFGGETATATAEGILLGSVGGNTGSDCTPAVGSFPLTPSQLATIVADGVVHVDVQNSSAVDVFCSTNQHTVRLSYELPVAQLDFGSLFVGASHAINLRIANPGTETLHVSAIVSSHPDFTSSPAALDLAPRTSQIVAITFLPLTATAISSTLSITSDDPDSPLATISLSGTGLEPPVAGVSPLSLNSTLFSGDQETQRLTLSNTGGSPLTFKLSAQPVTTAGSARSVPFAGLASQGGGQSNNPPPSQTPGNPPAVSPADGSWLGVPGDFDLLRSSSAPLTCVVEDLASGLLYAQANQGTAFYRYRVATDVWEPLASVPIHSGNNGGAALLNGRVYTSYTSNSSVGVYDIATNSWTTIPNPLGSGTGNIASDGTRYLYFVNGFTFKRFDPVTSITTPLAAPPFSFELWGAMRHLSGVLYGHQGNEEAGFASYNILTNTWALLPPVPAGAVLGSAIDPFSREYYTYGSYGGRNLYRYSIDPGVWSVATIPFFTVNDGGLGWLPSPVAGVYFVQGESGTGFARVLTGPTFLTFSPVEGTVPPSGSIDVDVTFDAAGLFGGVYLADLQVSSNDPIQPVISVPTSLTVIGVPNIQIHREPVTIESIQLYSGAGAGTSHALSVPIPPTGGGSIDLIADGDYGFAGETATATAEGILLGSVGGSSGSDCIPATGSFPLTTSQLATIAADGVVHVEVQNSAAVDSFCTTNQHSIRLTYGLPVVQLEFGSLFVGASQTIDLVIANNGTDVLHIGSIASSVPDFTSSLAALDLPYGASQVVSITFLPLTSADISGTLSISSDDPDTPLATIPLHGIGLEPPIMVVQPTSMDVTVAAGTTATRSLILSNIGESPLHFTLAAVNPTTPGSARAVPFAGLASQGGGVSNNPSPPQNPGDPGAVAGGDESWLGVPGDFDPLRASSLPLTCITEDPDSGMLYGQANQGTAFFRYRAAADVWEPLAAAPIFSANNCGAALLNGRIYTSYSQIASTLGVYDIASNSWTTIPNPIGGGTGTIASDGTRYLYLALGFTLMRFEPATSIVTQLAAPPFVFTAWGGMRHLSGDLYAHQGDGLTGFASYDIPTNTWTSLTPVPSGAVLGSAIDPFSREYYTYGNYSGRNLYRYSIDSHVWSVATIPFFLINDGGMGWLPSPVAGVYFVQGESGTGFARFLTAPGLLSLTPAAGSVAPQSSMEINVLLDGKGLPSGRYEAGIGISSNDPILPETTVPVTLTIVNAPNMVITGAPVTVLSSQGFSGPSARTSHIMTLPGLPGGDGTLQLTADGDFQSAQSATLTVEGSLFGSVGGTGSLCAPASGSFSVPKSHLDSLIADGFIRFEVQNSPSVSASCVQKRHLLRLTYPIPGDHLDFGSQPIGLQRTLRLNVANTGLEILHITSITSSLPEFVPSATSLDVIPGAVAALMVTFTSSATGAYSGALALESNDLASPSLTIPLSGAGVEAPVLGVQPATLASTLFEGTEETRTLTLTNSGAGPLHFALNTTTNQGAFLSVTPTTGVVPPAGFLDIEVHFDARSIAVGNHAGSISVSSDAPVGSATVAVSLLVVGRPAILLVKEPASIESTLSFGATAGHTTHTLLVPAPPVGNGSFDLIAYGDFLWGGQDATAYIEGSRIGSVNGSGGGCGTVSMTFPIPASQLTSYAQDGIVLVDVQNSPTVANICPPNTHTVRLSYRPSITEIDFGQGFLGGTSSQTFFVENGGTDVLHVTSISTDSPAFGVSPSVLTLSPGAVGTVLVTFSPTAEGAATGLLTLVSNDSAHPSVTLPVAGVGSLPPIVGVEPASLSSRLRIPVAETQPLTIRNSGSAPLSFSITVPPPVLMTVAPSSGIVPPSGSLNLAVLFESSSVPLGSHATTIEVASNDPVTPIVSIPVSFEVVGPPILSVQGPPVTVTRRRVFSTAGARTTHQFTLLPPPPSGVEMEFIAEGDFGDASETATANVESLQSITVGGVGGACSAAAGGLSLSRDEVDTLFLDGFILVTVDNTADVAASCALNRHTVSLTYRPVAEDVDFGAEFVGKTVSRTILLENQGTDFLTVYSITADQPEFVANPSALTVPPGGSQEVTLQFTASMESEFSGSFTIESDTPANPQVVIAAIGAGLPAPVLSIDPVALFSTLVVGQDEIRPLTLSNPGGNDLVFSAVAHPGAPSPFLSVTPESGTIPPGDSLVLSVHIDAAGLPLGNHASSVDIASNDPLASNVAVPVSLTVIGLPEIALSGPINFGQVFPGYPRERTLLIENLGSAVLHVTSIAADRAEFVAAPASLSIDPGGSAQVAITLTPVALGPIAGSLLVSSNDPDTPSLTVALTGTAVIPPIAGLVTDNLTIVLPPGGTTTRSLRISNTGGSALEWTLGGPGTQFASPMPPWISASSSDGTIAPGAFTDVTLTVAAALLPDGDHEQMISVHSNDPANARLDAMLRLHVGEVAPDFLLVEPATLNLASNGMTVRASVQLPAPLDPHNVQLTSVRLNGLISPIPSKTTFADENGDGREELILKFDRSAFQAIMPEGQSVPVTLTGEVFNQTWFRGTTTIRVIRPNLTAPNGGEYLLVGQPITIAWSPAPATGSVSYTILLSRDSGETWENVSTGLTTTEYVWTPTGTVTSMGLIRVLASDNQGVMGYDTSDTGFTIAETLSPPHGVSTLEVRTGAGGVLIFSWSRPGIDATHGPVGHYRVMRSASASAGFVEIGSSAGETFSEPATGAPGVTYYYVAAVNAAGESTD